MTVNAPAILAVLFALVMAGAGVVLAVSAVRGWRAASGPAAEGFAWESHRGLVMLLSLLIATAAAAATLAWVLLLQDLVPQWADVRCSVGVLRVGTGVQGTQGWLPALAGWTNLLLGAILVGAGGAAAAHLAGRDRPVGPPRRAHLIWLFGVGVLAVGAAACITAWIAISKEGRFLSSGCCAPEGILLAMDPPAGLRLPSPGNALARLGGWLLLCGSAWVIGSRFGGGRLLADFFRLTSSLVVLLQGYLIVSERVAPAVLGLPNHHCAWCLVGEAPEVLWGMALLALPLLAAAWSLSAHALVPAGGPATERIDRALRTAALFGLLGAPLFFAAERLAS